MTIASTLIAFAALALLAVVAGEFRERTFSRRLADAGRSRTAPPPQRVRIRL